MKPIIHQKKYIIIGIAAILIISGITMSFQNAHFGPIDKLDSLTELQDTIPEEKKQEEKMNMKDFDQLLQGMDKEMIKMQNEITKIDFDKMQKEISASLNNVDFDKIKIEIDRAIKEIDFAKIERGVETALDEIEWTKINNDVKASLEDAKKEIQKIDIDAIKKEIQKAELEIEKSKKDIKNIQVDEFIKTAKEGISKSLIELRMTKEMFTEMEKDRLIKYKEGFTIEYKDRKLFINGKKQNQAITNKYKKYIKGDSFKISIDKD